jgi:hypothetical protein
MDSDLRAALPGCGIVASSESGVGTTSASIDAARVLGGVSSLAPLVLLGYSAGCQGVRRHLLDGIRPSIVVAIDGTHASWPPAAWQIDVWRTLADDARSGDVTFAATCTQQRYTERLGAGQAYASTRTVLERATGAELGPGVEVHDGKLHLWGYPSADIDGAAHMRQQREALPMVLRTIVAPALSRAPVELGIVERGAKAVAHAIDAALASPARIVEPRRNGLAALEIARSQIGIVEATGRNDGPAIAAYFTSCTRRVGSIERPTGWASGWDWCAAFASWCGWRAAGPGDAPPHGRRVAVWELVRDARELGRWEDVGAWGDGPRPGDLIAWRRAGDPRIEGQPGHVSRCASWRRASAIGCTDWRLRTVGGNEENRVREADVSADLGRAVGVIRC